MDYISLQVEIRDEEQGEILTAELAEYPFESFETEGTTLKAYIPGERLASCKPDVDALLVRYGVSGRYIAIETQNWNAVWERNFPAHHATTWLVSRAVLDLGVAGRTGLDMGSGTGVLSIVAVKCGAAHVDAVDIDDWADANCRENVAMNGVGERITPMLGDVRRIAGRRYDFILANINRNILLADMASYAAALTPGGDLVMSGFLEADVPAIVSAAAELGLSLVGTASRDGWMMVHVRKSA